MIGLANWALWQFQRYATTQPWWWHVIAYLHAGVRQQKATSIRTQLQVSFCHWETCLVIPHNAKILKNVCQSHSSFQGGLPDTPICVTGRFCPWKSLHCWCIHKQQQKKPGMHCVYCSVMTGLYNWVGYCPSRAGPLRFCKNPSMLLSPQNHWLPNPTAHQLTLSRRKSKSKRKSKSPDLRKMCFMYFLF